MNALMLGLGLELIQSLNLTSACYGYTVIQFSYLETGSPVRLLGKLNIVSKGILLSLHY